MRIIKEIPAVEFGGSVIISPVGTSNSLYCRILNTDITARIDENEITKFLMNEATEKFKEKHGLILNEKGKKVDNERK